jgi:glycoside/pentoside/hexuronide:cation symporter, GPH family
MGLETRSRPLAAPSSCSLGSVLIYGSGECANSLVMNSVFAFAMLYYTKALHLDPSWAGLAMSVSVLWEAFTEPVIGHLSDNTRSRWGRRHPYMMAGGLIMAACSCLMWAVPAGFRSSQLGLFWYLVLLNLCLRAGLTLFCVPYLALGFELCTDYQGRSRIQSIRHIFNMAANLAGPALAWSIFFQDRDGIRGTTMAENYFRMGVAFSLATFLFVVLVVAGTFSRPWAHA